MCTTSKVYIQNHFIASIFYKMKQKLFKRQRTPFLTYQIMKILSIIIMNHNIKNSLITVSLKMQNSLQEWE